MTNALWRCYIKERKIIKVSPRIEFNWKTEIIAPSILPKICSAEIDFRSDVFRGTENFRKQSLLKLILDFYSIRGRQVVELRIRGDNSTIVRFNLIRLVQTYKVRSDNIVTGRYTVLSLCISDGELILDMAQTDNFEKDGEIVQIRLMTNIEYTILQHKYEERYNEFHGIK